MSRSIATLSRTIPDICHSRRPWQISGMSRTCCISPVSVVEFSKELLASRLLCYLMEERKRQSAGRFPKDKDHCALWRGCCGCCWWGSWQTLDLCVQTLLPTRYKVVLIFPPKFWMLIIRNLLDLESLCKQSRRWRGSRPWTAMLATSHLQVRLIHRDFWFRNQSWKPEKLNMEVDSKVRLRGARMVAWDFPGRRLPPSGFVGSLVTPLSTHPASISFCHQECSALLA